jgi:hypothetical protein
LISFANFDFSPSARALLLPYQPKDSNGAGQADREPSEVEQRELPVFEEMAAADLPTVSEHGGG